MSVVTESSRRVPLGFMWDNVTLHCPRCARYHAGLEERKFSEPVLGEWTHWATCPSTGEPILLQGTERRASYRDDILRQLADECVAAMIREEDARLIADVNFDLAYKGYY